MRFFKGFKGGAYDVIVPSWAIYDVTEPSWPVYDVALPLKLLKDRGSYGRL